MMNAMNVVVLLAMLAASPEPAPGWMGMGYVWSADGAGHKVLRVQRIAAGGPAAIARITPGDIITTIDGRRVDFGDELDLLLYLGDRNPGDRITFTVIREGRARKVQVKLQTMPAASRAAWKQNLEVAKRNRVASQSRKR